MLAQQARASIPPRSTEKEVRSCAFLSPPDPLPLLALFDPKTSACSPFASFGLFWPFSCVFECGLLGFFGFLRLVFVLGAFVLCVSVPPPTLPLACVWGPV